MTSENHKGRRRTLTGRVLSNKMDKTVTVQVERLVQERKFRKFMTVRKKYKAHDEQNACQIGDVVVIEECRPLSRHKRWMVIERTPAPET